MTFVRTIFLAALILVVGWGLPAGAQSLFQGGSQTTSGTPENPLEVGIGIQINQIVSVDQKSENYTAVVLLRAEWTEPLLAFDKEEAGREVRVFSPDALLTEAEKQGATIPGFVIRNQQSNRWIHENAVAVWFDGRVRYIEKSSLTLQAPHFNFLKYPFDTQEFHFEVESIYPSDYVSYVALEEFSGLGDMLGEEEWILGNARMLKSHVAGFSGRDSDRISLVFEGKRHLTYYIIRVFMPMLVLITVGWALFFLDEYRKRIEIAGGNLLVFVAFNWAISADLPKLGYLTFLDFILQWMFLVTGAIIVFNVVLRKIKTSGREDIAKKLDNYVIKWIYPLGYAAIVGSAVFIFLIQG